MPLAAQEVTSLTNTLENEIIIWVKLSWFRCLADALSSFLLLIVLSQYCAMFSSVESIDKRESKAD
jgi:hypothetical protein